MEKGHCGHMKRFLGGFWEFFTCKSQRAGLLTSFYDFKSSLSPLTMQCTTLYGFQCSHLEISPLAAAQGLFYFSRTGLFTVVVCLYPRPPLSQPRALPLRCSLTLSVKTVSFILPRLALDLEYFCLKLLSICDERAGGGGGWDMGLVSKIILKR